MPVQFFSEKISFKLKDQARIKKWIGQVVKKEKKSVGNINYIFCDDEYLKRINRLYLKHNYYTDIITFQHETDDKKEISGDVFISIDRVKENAEKFDVNFGQELHRVMIHGVLHLFGYTDKSKSGKAKMTQKEDFYLSLFKL